MRVALTPLKTPAFPRVVTLAMLASSEDNVYFCPLVKIIESPLSNNKDERSVIVVAGDSTGPATTVIAPVLTKLPTTPLPTWAINAWLALKV